MTGTLLTGSFLIGFWFDMDTYVKFLLTLLTFLEYNLKNLIFIKRNIFSIAFWMYLFIFIFLKKIISTFFLLSNNIYLKASEKALNVNWILYLQVFQVRVNSVLSNTFWLFIFVCHSIDWSWFFVILELLLEPNSLWLPSLTIFI